MTKIILSAPYYDSIEGEGNAEILIEDFSRPAGGIASFEDLIGKTIEYVEIGIDEITLTLA